jgi:hypothetical protein
VFLFIFNFSFNIFLKPSIIHFYRYLLAVQVLVLYSLITLNLNIFFLIYNILLLRCLAAPPLPCAGRLTPGRPYGQRGYRTVPYGGEGKLLSLTLPALTLLHMEGRQPNNSSPGFSLAATVAYSDYVPSAIRYYMLTSRVTPPCAYARGVAFACHRVIISPLSTVKR